MATCTTCIINNDMSEMVISVFWFSYCCPGGIGLFVAANERYQLNLLKVLDSSAGRS